MPRRPGSLAGPEHLDRVLQVTTPKGWLALATLLVVIAAAVVWSVVAEVATYVRGDGIFLSRGGAVFDAAAPVGGTLVRTVFALGDRVRQEEVVAEIHDEQTSERHASALALREERLGTLRARSGGGPRKRADRSEPRETAHQSRGARAHRAGPAGKRPGPAPGEA